MLTRVILLPCIFVPETDTSTYYYSYMISILHSFLESGIILIDSRESDESEILKSIISSIDTWIPKFRYKAKEIIKQLRKRNRFVSTLIDQPINQICTLHSGDNCTKLYTSEDFYSTITKHSQCVSHSKTTLVEEYSISPLFKKLDRNSFFVGNNEWTEDEFEEKILVPLFRDAKRIGIYDRWIGRSIAEGRTNHQDTIKWFLNIFQTVATIRTDTIFEVYCGIDVRGISVPDLSTAKESLRNFEAGVKELYAYFKLFVKEETRGNALPHDRYLITNQTAIYIGRGFDLFVNANEPYPRVIRDVQIGYCSNSSEVENHYKDRRLRDL